MARPITRTWEKMPTLTGLNRLDCVQNCLILLRVLNTSDMMFMYMLLEWETIYDIVVVCEGLFNDENGDLTIQQQGEYTAYLMSMKAYIEFAQKQSVNRED